jgi:hypothetical protein
MEMIIAGSVTPRSTPRTLRSLRVTTTRAGKTRMSGGTAPVKFTDHWEEEEEEDGTKILHDRERFSHELTLVFVGGKALVLTHEKKEKQ